MLEPSASSSCLIYSVLPSLSLFYFIFFRSLVVLELEGPCNIFLSINSFSQPSGPRPLRERFSVLFFKHTHPVAAAAPSHARDLFNVLPGKKMKQKQHTSAAICNNRRETHRPPVGSSCGCVFDQREQTNTDTHTHKSLFQIIIIMRALGYGV